MIDVRKSNKSFHFVGVSSSTDEATAADALTPVPAAAVAPILNINSIPDIGRRA